MLDNKGFDLWAEDYDTSVKRCFESNEYPFAGYKEVLGTIYDCVTSKGSHATVLDIGFGTGVLTKKLYDEGTEIYGIDFSEEMIKRAKSKMPNSVLIKHDFSKGLPFEFKEKKFDFIICTYSIHHLTDKDKILFINELKTHLTEGGKILLGDVAFETRRDLELCRNQAGDNWDQDEIYIVKEDLHKEFPDMQFKKISFCAGICII